MRNNGINRTNYIGVCTDGVMAMTAGMRESCKKSKLLPPPVLFQHTVFCTLAVKDIEPGLNEVMNTAVTIVNFVKARATNSRILTALCEEVGADHHSLFMHTEVR